MTEFPFEPKKITDLYEIVYDEKPAGGWLRIWNEMSSDEKQSIWRCLVNVVDEGRAPLTNWRFVPTKESSNV